MSYATDRKIEPLLMAATLATLEKKPPQDLKKTKAKQDERIHALMVRAYEIPFYRARFEATGTTPEDYHTAADLYKFPLLTKEELRDWTDRELAEHPEKYRDWHVNPTSGSTGLPLKTLFSPRENAAAQANWMRVLMMGGLYPYCPQKPPPAQLPPHHHRGQKVPDGQAGGYPVEGDVRLHQEPYSQRAAAPGDQ